MKTKVLLIILLTSMCVGFRIFPGGNLWRINKEDPTLWLKFCENMVPADNDVSSNDPLYGTTLTHNNVMDSIMNEYTAITGAYLVLADAARDTNYNSTLHAHRTIDICYAYQQELIEGYARPNYDDDGYFKGCEIKVGKKTTEKAKRFIRTVTHEIGHCLGLDHPHETKNAIMSYFSHSYRLQSDDKAGIVNLYPLEPGDVKPHYTLGLSCSPR